MWHIEVNAKPGSNKKAQKSNRNSLKETLKSPHLITNADGEVTLVLPGLKEAAERLEKKINER